MNDAQMARRSRAAAEKRWLEPIMFANKAQLRRSVLSKVAASTRRFPDMRSGIRAIEMAVSMPEPKR